MQTERINHFKKDFSITPNQLTSKLTELDASIKTWVYIANCEKIDITTELQELKGVRNSAQKKGKAQVFNLLLIEAAKKRIVRCLSRKIRCKTLQKPKGDILLTLSRELTKLKKEFFFPCIEKARENKVDISQELEFIARCNQDSIEELNKKQKKIGHIHEVALRRLILLTKQCSIEIICKIYEKRVQQYAQTEKEKCLPQDFEIIEGIVNEALKSLPKSFDLETVTNSCKNIYEQFRYNIDLVRDNPKEYHRLANLEWLHREIIKNSEMLLSITKTPVQIHEVFQCREMAIGLLNSDYEIKKIIEKVNRLFVFQFNKMIVKTPPPPCRSFTKLKKN